MSFFCTSSICSKQSFWYIFYWNIFMSVWWIDDLMIWTSIWQQLKRHCVFKFKKKKNTKNRWKTKQTKKQQKLTKKLKYINLMAKLLNSFTKLDFYFIYLSIEQ